MFPGLILTRVTCNRLEVVVLRNTAWVRGLSRTILSSALKRYVFLTFLVLGSIKRSPEWPEVGISNRDDGSDDVRIVMEDEGMLLAALAR